MKKISEFIGRQVALTNFLRKIVEINFRQQKKIIKKYFNIKPGERVLDLGCGTGELAGCFGGGDYLGIDLTEQNIAYAKSHQAGKFSVGDARSLSLSDGVFDKVLVSGLLHHLSDKNSELVLSEVWRVLKNGGRALIIEDTKNKRFITKLMHFLDQGEFVRPQEEWQKLVNQNFKTISSLTFNSGVCFYSAFLLEKGK